MDAVRPEGGRTARDGDAEFVQGRERLPRPVERVRPEIEGEPAIGIRFRPPTRRAGFLEDGHAPDRPCEIGRGGQPRQPAANDDYIVLVCRIHHIAPSVIPGRR